MVSVTTYTPFFWKASVEPNGRIKGLKGIESLDQGNDLCKFLLFPDSFYSSWYNFEDSVGKLALTSSIKQFIYLLRLDNYFAILISLYIILN